MAITIQPSICAESRDHKEHDNWQGQARKQFPVPSCALSPSPLSVPVLIQSWDVPSWSIDHFRVSFAMGPGHPAVISPEKWLEQPATCYSAAHRKKVTAAWAIFMGAYVRWLLGVSKWLDRSDKFGCPQQHVAVRWCQLYLGAVWEDHGTLCAVCHVSQSWFGSTGPLSARLQCWMSCYIWIFWLCVWMGSSGSAFEWDINRITGFFFAWKGGLQCNLALALLCWFSNRDIQQKCTMMVSDVQSVPLCSILEMVSQFLQLSNRITYSYGYQACCSVRIVLKKN